MERPAARDQEPDKGNGAPDAEGQNDREWPAVVVAGEGKALLGGVNAVKGCVSLPSMHNLPVKWHNPCPKAGGTALAAAAPSTCSMRQSKEACASAPHARINVDHRQEGQDALEGVGAAGSPWEDRSPSQQPDKSQNRQHPGAVQAFQKELNRKEQREIQQHRTESPKETQRAEKNEDRQPPRSARPERFR